MKAIIMIIQLCVALLLTYVSNGVRAETLIEVLNEMANNGTEIDGMLKLSVNGALGSGRHGIVYKGVFLPLQPLEVAIKFSKKVGLNGYIENEYKMYTYLEAIDSQTIENKGIPSIYYYGTWCNHALLAMTLLNTTFQEQSKNGQLSTLEHLILFREFVRVIKYIHSQGIIHYDLTIENIIIHNGRGFIFDFGKSTEMSGNSLDNRWKIKDDFNRFLSSKYNNVKYYNFVDDDDETNEAHSGLQKVIAEFKIYVRTAVFRVFKEFTTQEYEAQDDKNRKGRLLPIYDHLYEVINEEINKEMKNGGNEATSSASSSSSSSSSTSSSRPPISSIIDPFHQHEWHRLPVLPKYFEMMYEERIVAARAKAGGNWLKRIFSVI